jgi:hypothetical protein
VVDPLCHHNGGLKRVSEIDKEWKEDIEAGAAAERILYQIRKIGV